MWTQISTSRHMFYSIVQESKDKVPVALSLCGFNRFEFDMPPEDGIRGDTRTEEKKASNYS